jgi:tRNA(Ile)-lysidine synthetase-like protein
MVFFDQPSQTRQTDVALGIGLAMEGEFILFRNMRMPPAKPAWEGRVLPIPGFASLDSLIWDFSTTVETGSLSPDAFQQQDKFLAVLDADRVEAPLSVRCRLPGDAFEPLGMKETVRLSDFMAAQHMPRFQRDTWPLVCDAKGILWVPGYRIGERAKVTKDSTRWITIRICRPEESAEKYTQEKKPSPEEK